MEQTPFSPERTTRILLADDHHVVRQAVAALLESIDGYEVVAQASDAESAVRFSMGHKPDVAVLDLNMPHASQTLEAIPRIRDHSPSTRVVVLTMDNSPASAVAAMRAGASGYVLKEAADEDLVEAVRVACLDQTYLSPRIGAAIAAAPPMSDELPGGLTPRELDIVQLAVLGHTSREIGTSLFLSVRTVENHRSAINRKLDLTTRAELVRFALDHSLVRGSQVDAPR